MENKNISHIHIGWLFKTECLLWSVLVMLDLAVNFKSIV